ncbi:MAG: hypothetical protein JXA83_16175 [Acidimicrobiales bacterium]|nr:hypothetical protein [Acidimicrobiales bacterium]
MSPSTGAEGARVHGPDSSPTERDERASSPLERDRQDGATTGDGHAPEPGSPAGASSDADAAPAPPRQARRTALEVGVVTGVLAVPLVVALVAVRDPAWYPLTDLSQIEMRVRDVGSGHTPLVGLGGRIFGHGTQGAHPGPISFYLLAPVYRLLGSSPWALQASAAVLDVVALGATVWAGHRRWGLRGALLVAAGLALVMRVWGMSVLLFPWNPYLPVLFWMLLLVAAWGVLCGDLPLVPVAVVAGTVCAQTHLPYVGIVGGVTALMAVALVVTHRSARDDGETRRRVVRWSAIGLAVGIVLWLPVFVQQLGGDPGNLGIIVDSFRNPQEPELGLGSAWHLFLQHLNPARLVEADRTLPTPEGPGLALLVAWVASAVAAARLRHRTLGRLHVVVGAALVLGLISMSRILGPPWPYLTLWAYGTAVLALLAVVATVGALAAAAVAARPEALRMAGRPWAPVAALAVAAAVPVALLTRTAPGAEDPDQALSDQIGAVAGPTVEALEEGVVPGGDDGTYLVTWTDPVNLGGQGFGLMLELERRGYDARATDGFARAVRDHRVASPDEADAVIHVAYGKAAIDDARAHPGAEQIAYDDPRTDDERTRYRQVRAELIDMLEADGLDDLVPAVDTHVLTIAQDERVPTEALFGVYVLGRMGQPLAVYTWDPAS